jgi:hypothetical protein
VNNHKKPLTIDELQVEIFKLLISLNLPIVPNVDHPPILVEVKGRRLCVSQIDVQGGSKPECCEFKRLRGTSRYIFEEDSQEKL